MSYRMKDCDIVKYEETEMSEVRSWDRQGKKYKRADGEESISCPYAKDSTTIPVRVVAWPEGAPAQEDVPQAGERMDWGGEHKVIIYSGIPFRGDSSLNWAVLVIIDNNSRTHTAWLKNLKPILTPEPKLYSEDEIRAALHHAPIADSAMGYLKSHC